MLPCRSQLPSMAASLVGWYFRTPSPCRSPMKIWIGAKMAANHSAIDIERRAPATFVGAAPCGPRRIIQADMPATAKAVVR